MTVSVRKAAAMKLEAEYSQLRKEQADGNANNPNRGKNVEAKPIASPQIDTVTLSSNQADLKTPSEFKRSKPVTTAEKTALQHQFSVSA